MGLILLKCHTEHTGSQSGNQGSETNNCIKMHFILRWRSQCTIIVFISTVMCIFFLVGTKGEAYILYKTVFILPMSTLMTTAEEKCWSVVKDVCDIRDYDDEGRFR